MYRLPLSHWPIFRVAVKSPIRQPLCLITTTRNWIATVISNKNDQVIVYPNPAQEKVSVQVNPYAGEQQIAEVSLYDLTGTRILVPEQMNEETRDALEMNLSAVTGGLYVLNIRLTDGTIIRKPLMVR